MTGKRHPQEKETPVAKIGTVHVTVVPDIDLSGLDDDILEAIAAKVAEKLRGRVVPVYPAAPAYPSTPSYPWTRTWPLPYQVWC